jgi:hypothetical protein
MPGPIATMIAVDRFEAEMTLHDGKSSSMNSRNITVMKAESTKLANITTIFQVVRSLDSGPVENIKHQASR